MAITKYDEYNAEAVEKAKNTVIAIAKENAPENIVELFSSSSLDVVEEGIRNLNNFSSKCWILSAIILYTIVYDKEMYKQSGLAWQDYSKAARQRLGLDPREITEQLSGARFFIKYHDKLMQYGWDTTVPNQSLARGELALELSGDIDETLKHMINDTQRGFRDWYQSFKMLPVIPLQAFPAAESSSRANIAAMSRAATAKVRSATAGPAAGISRFRLRKTAILRSAMPETR